MEILLARHGEFVGNTMKDDLPDEPLTERGRVQAGLLAERMQREVPTAIVASPLLRSLETASIVAEKTGLVVLVWKGLHEFRWRGNRIGPPLATLRQSFPLARFGPDLEEAGWFWPGQETPADATERAAAVWRRLQSEFPADARVLVVGHGRLNNMILHMLLGVPPTSRISFYQDHTCINYIIVNEGRFLIRAVNDTSHLAALADRLAS